MVLKARCKVLALCAGLLLITGCASFDIKPKDVPDYLYLGTYGGAIAAEEGSLDEEQALIDEMAEGVGWWTAFKGAEHLLVEATGRPLKWWEKLLFWALPIAINPPR